MKKKLLVKKYATTTRRAYWDWNNTNLGIEDLGQINVTFPGDKRNRRLQWNYDAIVLSKIEALLTSRIFEQFDHLVQVQ